MRLNSALMTFAAFGVAAALALLMAMFLAQALESRSERHVTRSLNANGLTWADASADGLLVTLSGTAPSEAARFRAASLAGRVVGGRRVIDAMEVTPAQALTAPRFSLELLRNDDGISMIGLVPSAWDVTPLEELARTLAGDGSVANMVERADFAIPDHWVEATDFGATALRLLPRSKISVAADRVRITAISDSPAQKRRFENDLGRVQPGSVPVQLEISAPRPVVAPFTLRFVIEDGVATFDACVAETERARSRILAAGRRAGVEGTPLCTLGLGAPSPRWADAAEAVIDALAHLGAGSVTISDVDVSLITPHLVVQEDFDRVVGELTARLPDVFSLKSTRLPAPQAEATAAEAQFTATRSPEGDVQLRGRLTDARMRDAVEAFARARFGANQVFVATRLDDALPAGWGVRVLAGLAALAELHNGSLRVEPDRVQIRGISGNQNARAEVSRLLSDRLGQGASFAVDVTYNERLDPARGLPTPEECVARATEVLADGKISFAPGSADITAETARTLDELAKVLEDCAEAPIEIGGHTDSQGREQTNMTLSQRRAEAVLMALSERNVDTFAMTARGYGASEPIADNATEEGREANRRIELRLIAPTTAPTPEELIEALAEDLAETAQAEDVEAPTQAEAGDDALLPDLPEGEEPMGEAGDMELPEGDATGDLVEPLPDDPLEIQPTEGEEAAAESAPADGQDAADLVRQALDEAPPATGDPDAGAPDMAAEALDWIEDDAINGLRPNRRSEERPSP